MGARTDEPSEAVEMEAMSDARFTEEELKAKKPVTAKASADNWPVPRKGWEKDFADRLELQRRAGEIKQWDYEPERLRIAKTAFYKPDFRVIRNDGTIVFYEVKGHFRPAAIIRMKVVVERHPYIFYLVKKTKTDWDIQEFKP